MGVQLIKSKVEIQKQLPNSEEIIRLDILEGWEETTEKQKAFLCCYFDLFPKKIKACMQASISQSLLNKWIKTDTNFKTLMSLVKQIHYEELSYREYVEAYHDSKVRGRALKELKDESTSRTKNGNTFIFSGEDTMQQILDKIKK